MKLYRFFTCLILLSMSVAFILTVSAQASEESDLDDLHLRFATKHGELTFVNKEGKLDVNAVEAKLDGKSILSSINQKDGWGVSLVIMIPDSHANPYQRTTKTKPPTRPLKIDRIVVAEGRSIDCVNQFIILDFTGEKPFVSERFGYNPEGKSCLHFVRAKWGKKESYIYLNGPDKFVYYTGGRVIGPLE
ncbi:hypothetical protein KI811_16720 [Geobacter hydrogenophilus]|uniref:Uncharacterized protein n=1 Tax=Geobacter hydrogenophilus TaxID=40983 RepID=A0A9W6LDB1_9BACT|nr:hypothetical protein [Geobacter hydrogenophilus]MBT0895450.1 hypothetical protein [Geobacter hydrogenophilus]GLI38326.1 hypothetical protein GHYDROH2_18270 [Geobacter hydrogenophilus]